MRKEDGGRKTSIKASFVMAASLIGGGGGLPAWGRDGGGGNTSDVEDKRPYLPDC